MKQKPAEANEIKEAKVILGQLIKNRRNEKDLSLRSLARKVKIPVSNMKYIEDGVNAPGPEKYEALLDALSISAKNRSKYDSVYSVIRGTPPPDICKIICNNSGLNQVLRYIDNNRKLTKNQLSQIESLILSFHSDDVKGEKENG